MFARNSLFAFSARFARSKFRVAFGFKLPQFQRVCLECLDGLSHVGQLVVSIDRDRCREIAVGDRYDGAAKLGEPVRYIAPDEQIGAGEDADAEGRQQGEENVVDRKFRVRCLDQLGDGLA